MARKVIGLVIGSRAIKAVELVSRLGEYSIERYWLIDSGSGFQEQLFNLKSGVGGSLSVPEGLLSLVESGYEFSMSFPSELFFYRELSFPFSDKKKISQVIKLEAEGYFAFSLDGYLLDFLPPLAQGQGSQVLVFVLERNRYSLILSQLKSLKIDPVLTTIEGLGLPLLCFREQKGFCLWIELGVKHSILVGAYGETPFFYRRVPIGMEGLGDISSSGFFRLDINQERVKVWADSVLARVKDSFHWLERNQKGVGQFSGFEEVIISGEGALISGIDDYLAMELNLKVSKFCIPSWVKKNQAIPLELEPVLAEPLSLALAVVSREGKKLINFREGEFGWKPEFKIDYNRWAFPAGLMALILALGITKGVSQHNLEKRRYEQVRAQMVSECQRFFSGSVCESDPVSQIKTALERGKKQVSAYRDLLYPSAVEVLSAVGDQVPEEIDFVLSRYNYSGDKVKLEGDTSDFADTKEIVDRLSKVEFFKKVSLEDSRSSPTGRVNFSIQIELKNQGEEKK